MKCFFLSLFLYLPALLLAQIPTEFEYKADSVYSIVVAEGTYTGHLDENAMRSGHGILYYDGGGTYDGEFRNDKPHGYGVLDFPSACYEGWFVDGKKSGKGAIYHTSEFRYEGSFLNDKFDGYGIFYYADGGYSEGEWKNGLKHGKGILKFKGHCCEGEWENNRANGWGACYMDDGSWYEGLHVDGLLVHGAYYYADRGCYEGTFSDSGGHGVFRYTNGDCYEGGWKGHDVDGYGIIYDKDGRVKFQGYWSDDKSDAE